MRLPDLFGARNARIRKASRSRRRKHRVRRLNVPATIADQVLLRLEPLEERRLLAIDVVTSSADDGGAGTLRSVIADAVPGDTIEFAAGMSWISLASPISIATDVNIIGPGSEALIIGAQSSLSEAFEVPTGVTASISGMMIDGGGAGIDHNIYNLGNLTLQAVTLESGYIDGVLNTGSLTVLDSVLSENGIAAIETDAGGTAVLNGCLLSENSDGIDNWSGSVSVVNCTISGNDERGIANQSVLTVTDSTVAANGFVGIISYSGATATNMANTIVAGNGWQSRLPADVSGAFTATDHDIVGNVGDATGFTSGGAAINGNIVGTSTAPINPLLAPLGSYGALTQTMALLPGSPAINAGNNRPASIFCAAPTTDQRGYSRIVNGTIDIGAFESNGFTISGGATNQAGNQLAHVGGVFLNPLTVSVAANDPQEPVDGGQVSLSGPASGASIEPTVATIVSGAATAYLAANQTVGGPYALLASAAGAKSWTGFSLTNVGDAIVANTFPIATTEGATFSGTLATFTDADPGATPAATITWNDGTTSTGTVSGPDSHGIYTLSASHVFAEEAAGATVTIALSDTAGAIASASCTATVSDAALSATPVPFVTSQAANFSGTVATFTDGNPLATSGDFIATIDWGDNSPPSTVSGAQISKANGVFSVQGSHTYTAGGYYTATVTVNDAGGATATVKPVAAVTGTMMVTSAADDGSAGTLRSVIAAAIPGDTIESDLASTAIQLTRGLIEINKNLTIKGYGAIDQTTTGGARLFQIDGGATVSMSGWTLEGGTSTNGGAIYVEGGATLNVYDMVLTGNTASAGGAIFNSSGATLSVVSGYIMENSAAASGCNGDGIYNAGSATIDYSHIVSNSSGPLAGGGVFNAAGGTLTISDTFISNNVSTGTGGGFVNAGGAATLINCSITGNNAASGAGILNEEGGRLIVADSTVIGNQSNSSGGAGGIDNVASTASLDNTIVAANLAPAAVDPDVSGTFAATDHDLIGIVGDAAGFTSGGAAIDGNIVGTTVAPVDPLARPVIQNGLPYETALLPGSPAIDEGDNTPPAPFPSLPSGDQEGYARVVHGVVDIGAYESQGFFLAGSSGDNQSAPSGGAFSNPLVIEIGANDPNAPVDGGRIVLSGPTSGASIDPNRVTATVSGGAISVPLKANDFTGGPYAVTASTMGGAENWVFSLTNVAGPLAVNGMSLTATEGAPFSGEVATFTDVNAADTLSATITWNDGSTSAGTISGPDPNGAYTVNATHTFSEETAAGVVSVAVSNTSGATAAALSTAHVFDADVDVTGVAFSGTEGTPFNGIVAMFTDEGGATSAADFTATITWGDNTTTVGTISGPDANGVFTVTGGHLYADDDEYPTFSDGQVSIGVMVSDVGGGSGMSWPLGTYIDPPVDATAGTTIWAEAGTPGTYQLATFTDPGDPYGNNGYDRYQATIDWGDGFGLSPATITASALPGQFEVSGTYNDPYSQPGMYTATVTISHESAPDATVTVPVVITNQPLSPEPEPVSAVEGEDETLYVGAFQDPFAGLGPFNGPPNSYFASIEWGDGTYSFADIEPSGPDYFLISADHAYAEDGNYAATVTVYSSIAPDGVGFITGVSVSDPSINATPLGFAPVPATPGTFNVATFTDPGGAESLSDYSATIVWGDGNTSEGTISGPDSHGVFTVSGTNAYAAEGSYAATVTVSHDSSPAVKVTATATVAPVVSISPSLVNVVPGQAETLSLNVQDAVAGGRTAGFTYTIDWGDDTTQTIGPAPSGTQVNHVYQANGSYTATVTAVDQNSIASQPVTQKVQVTTLAVEGNNLAVGDAAAGDLFSFMPDSATTGNIIASLNGSSLGSFAVAGQIFAFGLGGGDTFSVSATGSTGITLTGEGSPNNYSITFGALAGPVTIVGNAAGGADSMDIYATTGGDSVTKNASQITWGSPATETVNYSGIAQTTLHLGAGNDTVYDPGANTTILGGPGHDTIFVTASYGQGVTVNSGDGSDDLTVNLGALAAPVNFINPSSTSVDTLTVIADSTTSSLDVSNSQVTSGAQTINYPSSSALTVETGTANTSANINSTPTFGVRLQNGGGAVAASVDLTGVQGPVTLSGIGGTSLTVNGPAGTNTLAVNAGGIESGAQAVLLATPLTALIVNTGTGDDNVLVSPLGGQLPSLAIKGGSGNTTVSLENLGSSMNSISVDGGTGTSSLQVVGSPPPQVEVANLPPATGTLLSSSLAGPASFGQTVEFTATVESLSSGAATPTGTVAFYDGGTPLDPDSLDSNGQLALDTSSLPAGDNTITAVYTPTGSFSPSTSSTLDVQVAPQVTVSDASGNFDGAAFVATATVTGSSGTAGPSLEGVSPTIEYYQFNGTGYTDMGASAPVYPGSYEAVATFPGSADYVAAQSQPAQFIISDVVTNTADSGVGSLREAILAADAATQFPVTIDFAIPTSDANYSTASGVWTIAPSSPLPSITVPAVIDGYSQPGASENTISVGDNAHLAIELAGSAAGSGTDGLSVAASGVAIQGLDINQFAGNGITLVGPNATGDTIQGNFIGTDPSGKLALGNGANGVNLAGASNNVIGGTTAAARNVISGNAQDGIYIDAASSGDTISGNYIGTDATGTVALVSASLSSPPPALPTNGLIGDWPLNGDGSDYSGLGRDLDLFGGAGFAPGLAGEALSLTGNTTQYASRTEDDNDYNFGSSDFTLQIWVNPATLASSVNGEVFIEKFGSDGWTLDETSGGGVQFFVTTDPSSENYLLRAPAGTLTAGVWNEIVVRRSRSQFDMFANGQNVASTTAPITIFSTDFPLLIGKRSDVDSRGFPIDGLVGDAAIWDRGLTNDEITGTYDSILSQAQSTSNSSPAPYSHGINVLGTGNTIGGSALQAGNVISGNAGDGVLLQGNNDTIAGNLIGTDATGTIAVANVANGVGIQAGTGNTIGGTAAAERNIISGNERNGVFAQFDDGNSIEGNYIGTDDTGTAKVPNQASGVHLADMSIGDTVSGNVVSGNAGDGVSIDGKNASDGLVSYVPADGEYKYFDVASGPDVSSEVGFVASYPGIFGLAFNFGGIDFKFGNTLAYVDIGNQASLHLQNFTISAWLKRTSTSDVSQLSDSAQILGGGVGAYQLEMLSDGRLALATVGGADYVASTGTVSDTTWHHVAVTMNNGQVVFYIDGLPEPAQTYHATFTFNGGDFSIGEEAYESMPGFRWPGPPNQDEFDGEIDEVRVYNRPLSATAVSQLANLAGETIVGNLIGTDASGSAPLGNAANGVGIYGRYYNTVGGDSEATANVISDNGGSGVAISGSMAVGNTVSGNHIGTDMTGTTALGNSNDGVYLASGGNLIGGTTAGQRNTISGNQGNGVEIVWSGAGNRVQGNYIGTDLSGEKALGNMANGVQVGSEVILNFIGAEDGTNEASEGNVISGNGHYGISMVGAYYTRIGGNLIGTDATGTKLLITYYAGDASPQWAGNRWGGVYINGTGSTPGQGPLVGNVVGGPVPGGPSSQDRNIISGNVDYQTGSQSVAAAGVTLDDAISQTVQTNYIGTDVTGTAALGNGYGIVVENGGDRIPINDNVISGNVLDGVMFDGGGAPLTDNYIGTNADGSAAVPNAGNGVTINGPNTGISVGGASPGDINLISGNVGAGVVVTNSQPSIIGNDIGTDITGEVAVPNGGPGIKLVNADANISVNLISGNSGDGIQVVGSTYDPRIAGASHWWPGDDTTNDSVPANLSQGVGGLNGTAVGNVTYQPGISGDAFNFDGSSNVQIPDNNSALDDQYSFTIAAWVMVRASNANGAIVSKSDAADGVISYAILGPDSEGRFTFEVTLADGMGDTEVVSCSSPSAPNVLNAFHQVAMTWDGYNLTGYVDGQNVAQAYDYEFYGSGVLLYDRTPLTIGDSLDGLVQDVRLYSNNVLEGTELQALYANNYALLVSQLQPPNSGNTITANFIGTDNAGAHAIPNAANGIELDGASGNIIGGANGGPGAAIAGDVNLISGNVGAGVYMDSTSNFNVLAGNFIGTDCTGTVAVANGSDGVYVAGSGNDIGGTIASGGDVTLSAASTVYPANNGFEAPQLPEPKGDPSPAFEYGPDDPAWTYNGGAGIAANGSGFNVVGAPNDIAGDARNLFGQAAFIQGGDGTTTSDNASYISQTLTLPADTVSVSFLLEERSPSSSPGGDNPIDVMLDNVDLGIYQSMDSTGFDAITTPTIQISAGSHTLYFIGTDPSGGDNTQFIDDVSINTSTPTQIAQPGIANTIAFNSGAGVAAVGASATGNAIQGNSILGNGKLGIDLGGSGTPVANDTQGHVGPNNFQNFPLITAISGGNTTTLSGSFAEASEANSEITIDFYLNPSPDASGYGQGATYLGSCTVTTDANGTATFSQTFNIASAPGQYFTATASDASGNTSEFSPDSVMPFVTMTSSPATVVPGQMETLTLNVQDALAIDQAAGFNFTINWGDGTTQTIGPAPSGTQVSHIYQADGDFPATVTAANQYSIASQPVTQSIQVATLAVQGNDLAVGDPVAGDTFSFSPDGSVAGNVIVSLNGNSLGSFAVTGQILAYGLDGGDTFNVSATGGTGITLTGEGSPNNYSITFGALAGPVTVAGNATGGADSMDIYATTGDDTISKNATQVTWGSPATETVNYAGIAQTTIHLGTGNDTVYDPGANTTILGGPGHDTIFVTASFGQGITVNSGTGSDDVTVDLGNLAAPVNIIQPTAASTNTLTVVAPPTSSTIGVTSSQVASGTQAINYPSTISNVTVATGTASTSVEIDSTSAAGVTVQNQGGTTTAAVALGNLAGPVNVTGTGSTSLAVTSASGNNDVAVSSAGVQSGSQSVNLNTAVTTLAVNTAAGNDNVSVSNLGSTVQSLAISGGSGSSTITLNDIGSSAPPITVSGGTGTTQVQVVGTPPAQLAYNTTTLVTSDHPSGSVYGQSVSFTATVATGVAGAGTPTGSVQFVVDGNDYGSPETLTNGAASFSISSLTAGPHTIYAQYMSDSSSYDASSSAPRFTQSVAPAPLTIMANDQSIIYGGTLPELTVTYSGLTNGDTTATFSASPNVAPVASAPATNHVGTYTGAIVVCGASDPNYAISYVAGTLTVTPAGLTISADSQTMTYGGSLPAMTVTYTGLANGDTAATFSTGTNVAPIVSAPATDHVGTYAGAILAFGASDPDYTISYLPGTLIVTPAALTITADDQTMVYGGSLVLTVTYSGLANGDTPATFSTSPNLAPSVTAPATNHVGTYADAIAVSGASDPDYAIKYVSGTLEITPAALTITVNNQSKVYGAALPTLSASYAGLANGDAPTSLTTAPTLSTTATAASAVGVYPITIGGAVDGDYTISYVGGTLAVTPATLTVTANSATKMYLTPNPALTYTISGFVNGDSSTVVSGAPSVSTTAIQASPAGTYSINVALGTLSAADYSFTFVSGSLTVVGAHSIYVLNPSAAGAMTVAGTSSIDLSGVVVVDSSSSSAIQASGSATVEASQIQVVGGDSVTGTASLSPAPATGTAAIPDPLASLPSPSTTGMNSYGSINLKGNASQTISPGIYSQISVSGNASLTLSTGVYIIEGGGLTITGSARISGNGVMIYNAGSALPNPGGSYGYINLSGTGPMNLTPQTTGAYAGVLIFQARDNTQSLSFSGSAIGGIGGTVYARDAAATISGNATPQVSLVVSTLSVRGNAVFNDVATTPEPGSGTVYTPAQIRTAYGLDNLSSDGAGQTIAIVDAYDDPTMDRAVDTFDSQFGLTTSGSILFEQYGPASSFLTVVNQAGQASPLPAVDPAGAGGDNWEVEEALDVEWAHAAAPGARIVLVEANSQSIGDLMASVATAADLPGVSVVSMSWGFMEGQSVLAADEALYDGYLTTPAGHQGVTFVASTGDYGAADPEYPAFSPNVIAVGGTTLTLNADNSYQQETGWGSLDTTSGVFYGGGGGVSLYEPEPSYQLGVQTTGSRTTPDVSFVADPNTGAWVADTYNLDASNPWEIVGGTSLSAPAWAGLMALVNQVRVVAGGSTLGSAMPNEAQQALYSAPPADYHDVTSGSNGYAAGVGYDLATGRGTPVADKLVPDLADYTTLDAIVAEPSPLTAASAVLSGNGSGGTEQAVWARANALSIFAAEVIAPMPPTGRRTDAASQPPAASHSRASLIDAAVASTVSDVGALDDAFYPVPTASFPATASPASAALHDAVFASYAYPEDDDSLR